MKYKVLKEFVTKEDGEHMRPGEEYINDYNDKFLKSLLAGEFIELVDEEWQPKFGDECYLVRPVGSKDPVNCWQWGNDDQDHASLDLGLAFKTKAEAEKMAKWLKAVKVLRRDSERSMAGKTLKDRGEVYFVYKNLEPPYYASTLQPTSGSTAYYNPFPFYSWDDAKASATEHEAEWLTFFGGFRDED